MKKVRVVGNPGTGKTTYLIDRVVEALDKGVAFDEILYLTFTRKAIREAIERIQKHHEIDKYEKQSFRTIHSLAFSNVGASKEDLIQNREYQAIALEMGIQDETLKLFMLLYSWGRLTGKSVHKRIQDVQEYRTDIEAHVYAEFVRRVEAYKSQTLKIDFNDLLKMFQERVLIRPLKLLIVDEAQDLSKMQWEVVRQIERFVTDDGEYYFAGDPHQAIFGWAGASVDDFHSEPVTEEYVLPQSYRVPRKIQLLSKTVLSYFTDPDTYPYAPKDESGKVYQLLARQYGRIPFNEEGTGSWLVLSHTWSNLLPMQEYLSNAGVPWRYSGKVAASPALLKKMQLVKWYIKLLTEGTASTYAEKKLRPAMNCTIEDALVHQYPWTQVFTYFTPQDVEQLKGLFNDTGVVLSTIHAIKGGEADNVVILGDLSKAIQNGFKENKAEQHMVLYVALTRCKENLYLVDSGSQYGYNWNTLLQESGLS